MVTWKDKSIKLISLQNDICFNKFISLVMGDKIKGKVIFCPKIYVVRPFSEISFMGYNKTMKGFPNITFEVMSLTKIKVVLTLPLIIPSKFGFV